MGFKIDAKTEAAWRARGLIPLDARQADKRAEL